MDRYLLLAFAVSLLLGIASAADAGQQSQPLSENLQLTSFSISPPSVYQGELVEFSLGLKSTGNTVSDYNASVSISDTSGAQAASLKFIPATIAGGETQALSKIWDTSALSPGNYSAIANLTEPTGASKVLLASLEVLPAPEAGSQNQPDSPTPAAANPACSSEAACGAPGPCMDNYTTQLCSMPSCPEKDYFAVQRCAPSAPPLLLRAEGRICKSASFMCTGSLQEDWLTSFCLSGLLAALVLFAALLFRTRHYGL